MVRADTEQLRASRIQLFSRLKLKNIFPGEWESIYTGEGVEFSAIKPFEPGDDARDLDLLALARTGEEEVIQRAAGRQMKTYIWADLSGSMQRPEDAFLPAKPDIRDIAVGLLVFSAWNAYSPVGLCAFDREIRQFFPAKAGESQCWEVLNWLIDQDGHDGAPADMERAFAFLAARAAPQSLVFLVSDFQDPAFEGDLAGLLEPVAKGYDLVPVVIRDPLEVDVSLPGPLILAARDPEGGAAAQVYLTPQKLKEMQAASARHLQHLEVNLRTLGLEPVVLASPVIEECHRVLAGYFEARRRTRV